MTAITVDDKCISVPLLTLPGCEDELSLGLDFISKAYGTLTAGSHKLEMRDVRERRRRRRRQARRRVRCAALVTTEPIAPSAATLTDEQAAQAATFLQEELPRFENIVGVGHFEILCYGTILQSHVILTTASCLINDVESSNVISYLNYEKVITFSEVATNETIYRVDTVHIFHKFNLLTWEHNIALMKLETPLPLSYRNDLQWIILADPAQNIEKCISILDPERYKGFGLTCDSKLIGIFSDFRLRQGNELQFISVLPYFNWIFEIILNEELKDMQNKNYTTSVPYQERKNAPMVDSYTNSSY
ncbi:uncharacterized protein LOC115630732 [Scaptodrosophila lebanonensis]|uniref:Uncharacterized protein LOC115630732 n=1 Tax=Drosophila lebanonensis TaxID=7225 RepID=A0A6J2U3N7_DROLE|nr:uncharacterized protein LOC115630732 [Scaptodrosophila lebanonensis]